MHDANQTTNSCIFRIRLGIHRARQKIFIYLLLIYHTINGTIEQLNELISRNLSQLMMARGMAHIF